MSAVDSGGLADAKTVLLQPQTVALTIASSPAGLTVGFNAGFSSSNGTSWTQVGSVTISMPATVCVGLPVTSHNNAALATAVIDQVAVNFSGVFQSQDIGAVGVAGSATLSGSTYTLRGGGADIWGAADGFRFAYQPVSGNSSIVARVDSVQNTNVWAKAGVMIRESLAPNARHVMMVVTPGSGTAFQRRTSTGGTSLTTGGPAVTAPYWVRVVRSNNTFTASVSTSRNESIIQYPCRALIKIPRRTSIWGAL